MLGARGDGAAAIGTAVGLAIVAIALPVWGYCILLFAAILADHHLWQFSPWTDRLGFYLFTNWWKLLSSGSVRRWGFLVANTVDLLLLALLVGVVLQIIRRRRDLVVSAQGILGLLYLLTLGAMFAYGVLSDGNLKAALWQVRPFVHFVVFALLGTQLLSSAGHVESVIWAFVAASAVKALQINWIFFIEEGGRFGTWREILGHEDSVFLAALVVLGIALLLYRAPTPLRWVLVLILPFAVTALVFNLRRAGYVAMAASVLLMPVMLHGRRRVALAVVASGLLVFSLYGAVAWNHQGGWLSTPLDKVKSIVAPTVGTKDASSNLYRMAENHNLRRTIRAHPLGLGFGHPFEIHMPLSDISFLLPMWQYHPHNMILGIWSAVGSIGMVVFLGYVGSAVMVASHNIRWHTNPCLKAISYFLLMSLVCGLAVSVVDQFIWAERGALFLGAVMAMVAVLHRTLSDRRGPDRPAGHAPSG